MKVNEEDNSTAIIPLKSAMPGDMVKGLDSDLEEAICEVVLSGTGMKGSFTETTQLIITFIMVMAQVLVSLRMDLMVMKLSKVSIRFFHRAPLSPIGGQFDPIDTVVWPFDNSPDVIAWDDYLDVYQILYVSVEMLLLSKAAYVEINNGLWPENFVEAIDECVTDASNCFSFVDILLGSADGYTETFQTDFLGNPLIIALRKWYDRRVSLDSFIGQINHG